MSNPLRTTSSVATILFALTASGRSAQAASRQEVELAQALFDEARALVEQRRFTEACPKFAESQRLDPAGGTLLNLAMCHEAEGKLVTAKGDYEEAIAIAIKDGRVDRQKLGRERLAGVEAIMPRIAVVVAKDAPTEGLEVKLDGMTLRREAWGVSMPVDVGVHTVQASAVGHATWSVTVTMAASQKKTVEVPALGALSKLPEEDCVSDARDPCQIPGGVASPLPAKPAPSTQLGMIGRSSPTPLVLPKQNPLFVASLLSAGSFGAVSAVTGFVALADHGKASSSCLPGRNFCADQEDADAAVRARTLAWVSTVTFGLAVAASAVAVFVPRYTKEVKLTGGPSPHGGALGISGSF